MHRRGALCRRRVGGMNRRWLIRYKFTCNNISVSLDGPPRFLSRDTNAHRVHWNFPTICDSFVLYFFSNNTKFISVRKIHDTVLVGSSIKYYYYYYRCYSDSGIFRRKKFSLGGSLIFKSRRGEKVCEFQGYLLRRVTILSLTILVISSLARRQRKKSSFYFRNSMVVFKSVLKV